MMVHHYNPWLVALSLAVATLAAYTTLDIALRVREASGRSRWYWLSGGSIALGLGIWSMHFIGMLAHQLVVPVGYDVGLTLLSILPAITATGLALDVVRRRLNNRSSIVIGGIFIGIGICSMHYIGMSALKMSPAIAYDPRLFTLSWLIAVGAAIAALAMGLQLRIDDRWLLTKKLVAAVVLGSAIAGMHYTGMAAAQFAPDSVSLAYEYGMDEETLAVVVGFGSTLVLTIALLLAFFDARLAAEHAAARARLEGEVAARTAELEKAVRARDEFLATASHELRTPLAVLKLQAQALQRQIGRNGQPTVGRDRVERFATQVDRSASSIALLVERMLDIANIDRGTLMLRRQQADLAAVTRDVIERMRPLLVEAGCILHQDLRGPVSGEWDVQRLEQIISNLLLNVARHASGSPVTVTLAIEEDRARLVVADQGRGIAREQHARIFERFTRAAVAEDGSGLGLGLAVTRELVRAHGGRIWVESEIGRGAQFIVELPMTAADQLGLTAAS